MGLSNCLIAMGGNLGNVAESFRQARRDIAALTATRVTASSLMYTTPPLGPAGQPDYLNAVLLVSTALEPLQLLDALQTIENTHGRERGERWGARTLDLDILDYGNRVLHSERLTLPHPRLHERQFVLLPLCDIAENWQHPLLRQSASSMLRSLWDAGEKPLPPGRPW